MTTVTVSKSISRWIDIDLDVDVELADIPSAKLREELGKRDVPLADEFLIQLRQIWEDMRGHDCPQSLRDLIYKTIGRIL